MTDETTTAEKGGETPAIVAAALDYYEGWFDGEPERMERALHPDLVKRSLASDGRSVDTISAREMVEATADGKGRTRDPGSDRRSCVRRHCDRDGDECRVRRLSAARPHDSRLEDCKCALGLGRVGGIVT